MSRKYESMILCPDSDAGYTALHEAVQDGWECMFHWIDAHGNHIVLRRLIQNDHRRGGKRVPC